MSKFKKDFPIFRTYPQLVYMDSAATSQKPQAVIDSVSNVYLSQTANPHRGLYDLASLVTNTFEAARQKVANFIGASSAQETIFTSGATESLNVVALGWAQQQLKRGDIVVLTDMEHHSNIVPWQLLAQKIGIKLHFLPIDEEYRLNYQAVDVDMSRVKLLALTQASNVLGTVNPVSEIAEFFSERGATAALLVDAAQSSPHLPINVTDLGADFVVCSSHKMLGPSGIGVLWVKSSRLPEMEPALSGSHMISRVSHDQVDWAEAPDKFEPGTRNIEGAIGLGAAIDYLNKCDLNEIQTLEQKIMSYTLQRLLTVPKLQLYGPTDTSNRLGVFSFNITDIHAHDVAEILNRDHIAVRAGHHCAQPLMKCLNVPATVRASLYLYNSTADVDALIAGLKKVPKILKI